MYLFIKYKYIYVGQQCPEGGGVQEGQGTKTSEDEGFH